MEALTDDPALSPRLVVKKCEEALEFYRRALGAEERYRLVEKGTGRIGHAEMTIYGSVLMLSSEYPEMGILGSDGKSPVRLHLMVPDVDAALERARAAGATVIRPPTDEFYGHRAAVFDDPYGFNWMLGQEKEKLSPQEMQRRYDALMDGMAGKKAGRAEAGGT
ncbi:VOC family protein [Roseococcus sp. SYP-B2431]|uniref:VOC family protein n=1 Tax=Roseococcus sp. SYP-B2431 TaxID=2496640 RepID=UPI00103AF3AA|nr:VOC family protein [Roseococcus sp. SYP-B2431]TCH98604.1 VOC family protein [Roseococcus sp. SYP-B2431]